MEHYQWEDVPREELTPSLARQVIHADGITVARIHFRKGCVVPEHSHENEQISMIEQGTARFVVAGQERVLKAGHVLRIPPNVPHRVEALEACVVLDLFSPRREDWISGDDSYLRK